jgi:WD40 repeat protein/tetratricopeptide (TPR) repeat protein
VAGVIIGALVYGVRKGELAEEQSRFAQEKEASERKLAGELRQVLVGRGDTVRLARQPGYRRQVWADLRQAMAQPGSGTDLDQIRTTVLACLGDPIGLDPVKDPTTVPRCKQPELPSGSGPWTREAAGGSPVAVLPDGSRVVVAGRAGGISVFNREGKLLRQESCPLGFVYDLALTAEGKVLVAGCEQGFVVWDLAWSERWVVQAGNVFSVAISPNGRLLACGGRQLELWSLSAKRLLESLAAPAAGARVEFSADGRTLLAVVNGTPAAGWPVSDTPERRQLNGHTQGVPALAFSPDGQRLVSVSKDRTVRVWDATTGRPQYTLTGHPGEIEAVAFNPDSSLLATGDLTGRIRVWDPRSGELLTQTGRDEWPPEVWRLQFGPGGEYLAAAGAHIVVWTVRQTQERVTLERLSTLASKPGSLGMINLAPMPGSAELVYLNRGGWLSTYDLSRADEPQLVAKARVALRSLHFIPSGERFTFITRDGTLGLWDWHRKETTDTHRPAESVAVSADGRWAAVGEGGRKVTVVELASGQEVFALPPEGSDVWSLAWAPDGTKLAFGLSDGAVAVWDLAQVRTRLTELGLETPSTARSEDTRAPAPVPAFERVVQVNRLRVEAERGRRLASEARQVGDYATERAQLLTALNRDERLAELLPDATGHRKRLAWTHGALARALSQLGDSGAALKHLETEAALLERLLADEPGNPLYRRLLASRLTSRSQVLDRAGQLAEAVDEARRAVTSREELAAEPGTTTDREQLSVAYHNLGFQLVRAGKPAEAARWYDAALDALDRLAADVPAAADAQSFRAGRGMTLHNLGVLRARAGDRSAAEKRFREAAIVQARLADDFPANPDYASDLGRTLERQGQVLRDLGQLDEAVHVLGEAARRQGTALNLRPKNPAYRELCCNHQEQLAVTFQRMDRDAEAAAAAQELQRLAPDDPMALLRAARLLAGCVALAERSPGFPCGIGWVLARQYHDEVVALARKAVAKGLADATRLLFAPEFDPVREDDDFRLLVDELKGQKQE